MRQEVREAVRAALESEKNAVGFHVLTISFENRSLSIPYQPWAPRQTVSTSTHYPRLCSATRAMRSATQTCDSTRSRLLGLRKRVAHPTFQGHFLSPKRRTSESLPGPQGPKCIAAVSMARERK